MSDIAGPAQLVSVARAFALAASWAERRGMSTLAARYTLDAHLAAAEAFELACILRWDERDEVPVQELVEVLS